MVRRFWLGALFCAAALHSPAAAAPKVSADRDVPYTPKAVLALSEKAADYQIATLAAGLFPANASSDTPQPRGWVQGALLAGMTYLADRSPAQRYRTFLLARGRANAWALGPRTYHADDHTIGQAYLWAAAHGAGPTAVAPMRATFDRILASPPTGNLTASDNGGPDCSLRWCWCDALFMAPPVWAGLGKMTGDQRYTDYAKKEFLATAEILYDRQEHLFYRDSRFFARRGPDGEKMFWSRGNGWVYAGLARFLDALATDDPDRGRFVALFREMSVRLKALQLSSGYWAPSLLENPKRALPESSGTAFYVYGMAWGIRHGLLDRAAYEPAVRTGWAALVHAVQSDGKVGYVQPVGDRPDNVTADDTQLYGVGGFLMAAAGVSDLNLSAGSKADAEP